GPLREPVFRALWIAATFSYVGTFVQDVSQSWLMLTLTRAPLLVASLTTCFTFPAILLTFPSGVLADRMDRRSLLVVSQAIPAFAAAALACVTWFGAVRPVHILITAVALGV